MKKRNKLFAAMLTLGVSAAMCMGFAGCGEEKNENPKEKDENPEEIVSETVTQAEWEAALSETAFANVQITVTGLQESKNETDDGKTSEVLDANVLFTAADGTEHYTGTVVITQTNDGEEKKETDTPEWYSVQVDKKYKLYEKHGNEWEASIQSFAPNMSVLYYLTPLKTEYEKYSYDEKENAYVFSSRDEKPTWDGKNVTEATYKLKFKDGKLKFIELYDADSWTGGSATSLIKMTFTYGGQTVTLPEGLPEVQE